MSISPIKLLELQGIESLNKDYYLKVALTFEENHLLFWKVDDFTARNILPIIDFNGTYKYRLSFHSYFNVIENQVTSLLNKTFKEHSEQIHFSCSQEYTEQLSLMKKLQEKNQIEELPFIYQNLPLEKDSFEEEALIEKPNVVFSKLKGFMNKILPSFRQHQLKRVSLIPMSMAFIILFGYFGLIHLDSPVFNENTIGHSIQLETSKVWAEERTDLSIIPASIQVESLPLPIIQLEAAVTYDIPKGSVALTFDDGPSKYSSQIAHILKSHNAGGTFFFTGNNMKKYPEQVRSVYDSGYALGTHSSNHYHMSTLSEDLQKSELIEPIQIMTEIIGTSPTLFRPPYGAYNKSLLNLLHEEDTKMVLWNVDPKDWQSRDAEKIIASIQSADLNGSIILLHESQAVIDALPEIINILKEKNLEIINLQ